MYTKVHNISSIPTRVSLLENGLLDMLPWRRDAYYLMMAWHRVIQDRRKNDRTHWPNPLPTNHYHPSAELNPLGAFHVNPDLRLHTRKHLSLSLFRYFFFYHGNHVRQKFISSPTMATSRYPPWRTVTQILRERYAHDQNRYLRQT